jgi:hypothetical protein
MVRALAEAAVELGAADEFCAMGCGKFICETGMHSALLFWLVTEHRMS